MTVFWTFAYNAEKTIARAIESIISQRCGDFIYYVLDNGSTDSTGQIIHDYAAKDSRIIPLHEQVNIMGATGKYLDRLLETGENGYFALLDADDEYTDDFLEKTLDFANSNNLDAVACGTQWVSDNGIRNDVPEDTLVMEGSGFIEYLPKYYRYTNRMWSILFSRKLLRRMQFATPDSIKNKGGSFRDAMYAFRGFTLAKRAGLMAEIMHKYYVRTDSVSLQYSPDWFKYVNEAQNQLSKFIESYGAANRELSNFLHIQYLTRLKYILPRIMGAEVPAEVKLRDLTEIVSSKQTCELMDLDWKAVGIYSDKEDFISEIYGWIEQLKMMSRGCIA